MKEFQRRIIPSKHNERGLHSLTEEEKVVRFYEIPPIKKSVRNLRGLVNSTFELDDLYFLTIYSGWATKELEAVSKVANGLPDYIPLAKPLKGKTGYTVELDSGPALLSPRLEGTHYVETAHTDKIAIPRNLHTELARFFWKFQKELSATPDYLKNQLTRPSRLTIGLVPENIPDLAKPLEKYAPKDQLVKFKYLDLIHDDMERQNILTSEDKVTGIVDLDSIHTGDILYEFGHFIFNNVFCDPEADSSIASIYIEELMKAGIIDPRDIPTLYDYIYMFAISDIVDFLDLAQKSKTKDNSSTNLELLASQYDRALLFAHNFFKSSTLGSST